MSKELLLKLLDETEDTLTGPLQEKLESIKAIKCPTCGINMLPTPDYDNPFDDSPIPRYFATCPQCNRTIDPSCGRTVE